MKTMIATLFITLLVFAGSPTVSKANTTSTLAPISSCDPCGAYMVDAHDYNLHTVFFYQGHVHVNLSGDGDTDLDLYVYDSDGREIARRVGRSDDETMGLNIYRSGYFTIKVKNLGRVFNAYRLWIN